MNCRTTNVVTLREVLPRAEAGGYAVGSFSPRYLAMIRPVLRAGQQANTPIIVQISANEFRWFQCGPAEFAAEFYAALAAERITTPVVLHLDHTKNPQVIHDAIRAGFTSVMIDRSELPVADNIAATRGVVEFAHARGVSVEAELGRIFSSDQVETAEDQELYTDPEDAARFAAETGVDALAVSVGTAHGVYMVRQPRIDYERLRAIRRLTAARGRAVHLVLHGGSGVPAEMIRAAIRLPDGAGASPAGVSTAGVSTAGVSKVNIATDLELAMLAALGLPERTTNAALAALSPEELRRAEAAVEATVLEKINGYLGRAAQP